MAKSTLVFYDVDNVATINTPPPTLLHRLKRFADLTLELRYTAPEFKELASPFCHALWHKYSSAKVPQSTIECILESFHGKDNTYAVRTKLWYLYCQPRKIDPLNPTYQHILEHLTEETYRDTASSQSCLTWILPHPHGKMLYTNEINQLCNKRTYVKPGSLNNARLQEFVWDPDMILDYYLNIPDNHVMNLMELSQKAAVLTLLATGKRPSEVRKMSLDSYVKTNLMYKFVLTSHTKTSRVRHPEDRLIIVRRFKKLPEKVCLYKAIQDYITASYHTHRSPVLFVTTTQGNPISPGTLARWTRDVMSNSGIDTSFFKPYSTRAATSSTAAKRTRSLDLVLKLGNWHTTSSFFKHYLRKVKYFDRHDSKTTENKEVFHEQPLPNVLAAPVRKYTSYSLKRALSRCRHNNTRTPYLDAQPENQGYIQGTGSSDHFLEIDSAPSSPSPSIASSTVTDLTDVSALTVADLIPHQSSPAPCLRLSLPLA